MEAVPGHQSWKNRFPSDTSPGLVGFHGKVNSGHTTLPRPQGRRAPLTSGSHLTNAGPAKATIPGLGLSVHTQPLPIQRSLRGETQSNFCEWYLFSNTANPQVTVTGCRDHQAKCPCDPLPEHPPGMASLPAAPQAPNQHFSSKFGTKTHNHMRPE